MIDLISSTPALSAYPALPQIRNAAVTLDFNENRFGCPAVVRAVLRRAAKGLLRNYPSYESVRGVIAGSLGIDAAQLLPTNGADEAIRLVFHCAAGADREVIIPSPGFSLYEHQCTLFGIKAVRIPYNADWSYPGDALISALSKVKPSLVVINSPHNPLGTMVSGQEVGRLCEAAPTTLVVLDATYALFSGVDYVALLHRFENLCIIHSYSKAFGIAGLRFGFITAAAQVIERLNLYRLPFSVNSIASAVAQAIGEDKNFLPTLRNSLQRQKKYLIRQFGKLGIAVKSNEANFLLVRFGDTTATVCTALKQRGFWIKDVADNFLLNGYCRITIGTAAENRRLMEAVRQVLEQDKGQPEKCSAA
ncbi:MAG: histidinol-phosphate aminotransferase family protein [Chitinivibrionales bacterium]|nr:histidinol-phosphate aminotransferase family protein [Chitinivibrionales bacterium]